MVERILVAAERSGTRAVDWAAELAERYGAELVVVEVVAPEHVAAGAPGAATTEPSSAGPEGERIRTRRVYDSDEAARDRARRGEEQADLVVVGGAGMSDRTEFLLASVPNRVSHTARCSVVIVSAAEDGARPGGAEPPDSGAEPSDADLLGRAGKIGRVLAGYGGRHSERRRRRDGPRAEAPRRARGARTDVRASSDRSSPRAPTSSRPRSWRSSSNCRTT